MNPSFASDLSDGLAVDLRTFRDLCEAVLALTAGESQALSGSKDYKPSEFNQGRKRLLPELESALMSLRKQIQSRCQAAYSEDVKILFQTIQSLLMKVLFLDRENQQALLRRGLVPAKHLPSVATQQPHYVAGLYQQHSRVSGGRPV